MAVPNLKKVQGNSSSTTSSSSITDIDTSLPLSSDTNFAGEGMVIIDEGASGEEFAYATGKSGSSLTIPVANRGLEGSSAEAHDSGASVKGILTADMWNDVIAHLLTEHNDSGTHAGAKPGTIEIYAIPADTSLTTGDGKAYITIPEEFDGMDLSAVHARVITAPTGAAINIQVHNVADSVDMLSTVLSIDATETGSDTAATPAVIDADNDDVVTNDLLRIDIDQVGSTVAGKGLIVRLRFS